MIFHHFAEARNWLPEQVLELTLRQLGLFLKRRDLVQHESDQPQLGDDEPTTKAGRKFLAKLLEKTELAQQNLMEGRRWDVRRL